MAEEKENQEEQKEEGKKSNLMVIIVGAFLAVLLLIGGILAYVLLSGSGETPEGEAQVTNSENPDTKQIATARRKSSINVGPMFELDTFIVNLLSENGRRYLKVKINLELSDEALQEEINKKIPVIRDIVIKIASSKTLEEISTEKGKEKFKDQIVGEINQNLQDGKINNVYFTDFVIQ